MSEKPVEAAVFDGEGALSREYLLARGCCCDQGCRNCPYRPAGPEPERRPEVPE